MSKDIKHKRDGDRATGVHDIDVNVTLKLLDKMLDRHGRKLSDFDLPDVVGDGSLPA